MAAVSRLARAAQSIGHLRRPCGRLVARFSLVHLLTGFPAVEPMSWLPKLPGNLSTCLRSMCPAHAFPGIYKLGSSPMSAFFPDRRTFWGLERGAAYCGEGRRQRQEDAGKHAWAPALSRKGQRHFAETTVVRKSGHWEYRGRNICGSRE